MHLQELEWIGAHSCLRMIMHRRSMWYSVACRGSGRERSHDVREASYAQSCKRICENTPSMHSGNKVLGVAVRNRRVRPIKILGDEPLADVYAPPCRVRPTYLSRPTPKFGELVRHAVRHLHCLVACSEGDGAHLHDEYLLVRAPVKPRSTLWARSTAMTQDAAPRMYPWPSLAFSPRPTSRRGALCSTRGPPALRFLLPRSLRPPFVSRTLCLGRQKGVVFALSRPRRPALEVALLGEAGGATSGGPVAGSGACEVAGHLQQVGAHRVEAVVSREPSVGFQPFEQRKSGARALHHRERDGAIERDYRVVGDALEQAVKDEDLRPVSLLRASCFGMNRGDRRLDLVRAQRCPGQGVGDEGLALPDELAVPPLPVLLFQRDQGAVWRRAGRASSVRKEHKGEQPGNLIVIGQQPAELAGQADRLTGELCAREVGPGGCSVALVEDQVQYVQYHTKPLRPFLFGR